MSERASHGGGILCWEMFDRGGVFVVYSVLIPLFYFEEEGGRGICLFVAVFFEGFLCWSMATATTTMDMLVVTCACSGVWISFFVPSLPFAFSGSCTPSIIPLALGSRFIRYLFY